MEEKKQEEQKQRVIISVGRQFGSGGHMIAEILSKRFKFPIYDHRMLEEIAREKEVDQKMLARYDEKPASKLFSRTVSGHSSSLADNLAQLQFDFLKRRADSGESFVVVGRCSETVLKDCEGLITIYIVGDEEPKRRRIMDLYHMSEPDAKTLMTRKDWIRKSYHNSYCKGKWGDSRNYDICVNSSRLGIEGTADILEQYVRARMERM